jgi:hypothetical protein
VNGLGWLRFFFFLVFLFRHKSILRGANRRPSRMKELESAAAPKFAVGSLRFGAVLPREV